MALQQWRVSFSVNGRRTEQIVSANSSIDVKKIIQAQFVGQKLTFWTITRV